MVSTMRNDLRTWVVSLAWNDLANAILRGIDRRTAGPGGLEPGRIAGRYQAARRDGADYSRLRIASAAIAM